MGSMQAWEMARLGAEMRVPLDVQLHYHLTVNHYPPVPQEMVPAVKRAVLKARAGDFNSRVRLPKGITHRRYKSLVPVSAMVESYHLEAFVHTES